MITTREGNIKNRGDVVFEIAYCITRNKYVPLRSNVHISLQNENKAFDTFKNCEKECELLNKTNQHGKNI